MLLNNKTMFDKDYLCVRNLVIMSDGEYGYHIYFQHGYKDIEFSFYTDYEDLIKIINELSEKVDMIINNGSYN